MVLAAVATTPLITRPQKVDGNVCNEGGGGGHPVYAHRCRLGGGSEGRGGWGGDAHALHALAVGQLAACSRRGDVFFVFFL